MAEQGAVLYAAEAQAQHRRCSSWMLVLAITLPYVVLTAFMAVTVYTSKPVTQLPLVHEDTADDNRDIFIQFDPITDINLDEVLSFKYFKGNKVNLVDQKVILVPCNGPYLLHAYVCSEGLDGRPGAGHLELRLAGGARPPGLAPLPLESGASVTCEGLQASVYLRWKDNATLHLTSQNQNLRVKNVTLGLHYLLGQCQF